MEKLGRIAQFEKFGMGVFIHYGLYSLLGRGEWALHAGAADLAAYKKLTEKFTAEKLDFREIARTVKAAGAKYITLTTRHHDGFSLYDTRGLSDFDAPHSAAGRDLIAEFTEGCRAEGIVPFFYHTAIDWTHPTFQSDFHAYQEYLLASVEVLCRHYGKVGGFWFDGFWDTEGHSEPWRQKDLYKMIRSYQPDTMIINNTGLSALGEVGQEDVDSVTFERGKPRAIDRTGKYYGMEMCQILNSHWGYAAGDINYKSMASILDDLADCRRFGANLLLNYGPEGDGGMRTMDRGYFEELAAWYKVFGEALAGLPCEVRCEDENAFVIKNGDKYYLFMRGVSMAADPNVQLGGAERAVTLKNCPPVREIVNLNDGKRLNFVQDGDQVTVRAGVFDYGWDYYLRVSEVVFRRD